VTRRVSAAALAGGLVLAAGCASSHPGAAAGSTTSIDPIGASTTTTSPVPITVPETLTVTLDRTDATVGTTIRVGGTGCQDVGGSTVGVTVEVAMTGSVTQPVRMPVEPNGSFHAALVVSGATPPGDQPVWARCWGSPAATTTTTGPGPAPGAIGQGQAMLHVTAMALSSVAPTTVAPGATITVRGPCVQPGSTYEGFVAWLARPGETFMFPPSPADDTPPPTGDAPNGSPTTADPHDGLPGGHAVAGGGCAKAIATATITVPAAIAPGIYLVRAATYAERPPVERWFQPVEVTVTPP